MGRRTGLGGFSWIAGLGLAAAAVGACFSPRGDDCQTGSESCRCTDGNGCDPGLRCVGSTCIMLDGTTGDPTTPGTTAPTTTTDDTASTTGSSTTSVTTTTGATSSESGDPTMGVILDVGQDTDSGPDSGCREIDVLFVLDSSGSMTDERAALAATNAFSGIVGAMEGLNGGGVRYRIGVTDDHDSGFFTPSGWAFDDPPWFDSELLDTATDPSTMVLAFNGAVQQLGVSGGPAIGCEHVLSSGVAALALDTTGFVRDDALLVLVLVTDVDDYGAYDQIDGNTCGLGCATPPTDLTTIRGQLVDGIKGGVEESVAAIVIAGDPSVSAGLNFCEQPGSCGCDGVDCQVFHATRLYEFADTLGTNGVVADICSANVPMTVEAALTDDIDLACQNFEPEG